MIRWLSSIALAASLVFAAAAGGAYCNIANTTTYGGFIFKILTNVTSPNCTTTMSGSGTPVCQKGLVASGSMGCSPAAAGCLALQASIGAPAPNYCQWNCTNCGTAGSVTIRIDGSDGLPVELLEIQVE